MMKYSTIVPSARTGRKVNVPTIRMVPTSNTRKVGLDTGKLPACADMSFFLARLPARAITGMITDQLAKPGSYSARGYWR
jgi:hypothetical protein